MLRIERVSIYENAIALFESGQLIAGTGYYGLATSLLILSMEEFIKYQIVLHNAGDEEAFGKDVESAVFRRHKMKHSLLIEFQQSLSPDSNRAFEEKMFKFATTQMANEKDEEVEVNRFMDIGSFIGIAFKEINLNETDRIEFVDWLPRADKLKNKGLYVNLASSPNSFPSDVGKEEYDRALKFAIAVQKQTRVMKDLDLTPEEFISVLKG
jgi:AbiV family abortive infection protein